MPKNGPPAIDEAGFVNIKHVPAKHHERKHRDEINDQKGGCQEEISEALTPVEEKHRAEEKQEGERNDKDPALK